MRTYQNKARRCRSMLIGSRLECEIQTLRGLVNRIEDTVAQIKRPKPLFGRQALLTPRPGFPKR